MKVQKAEGERSKVRIPRFGLIALALLLLIGFMFRGAFRPGYTVASNDGPLGVLHASYAQLPDVFKGNWNDLNWVGLALPTPLPDATQVSNLICKGIGGRDGGPVLFSKIYAPLAIFFVGICAWICFRQ